MRLPDGLTILVPALAVALSVACQDPEPPTDTDPAAEVAGTWIRMFPPEGAPDTLVLRADGTLHGSTAGLDSSPTAYERWWIGDRIMPGGLCFGEAEPRPGHQDRASHCQGYRVSADTLWLANERRTAFLRAAAAVRAEEVVPWTNPRGGTAPPVPLDSVQASAAPEPVPL